MRHHAMIASVFIVAVLSGCDTSLGLSGLYQGTWEEEYSLVEKTSSGGSTTEKKTDVETEEEEETVTIESGPPGTIYVVFGDETDGGRFWVTLRGIGNSYKLVEDTEVGYDIQSESSNPDAGQYAIAYDYRIKFTEMELTREGSEIELKGKYKGTNTKKSSGTQASWNSDESEEMDTRFTFKGKKIIRE